MSVCGTLFRCTGRLGHLNRAGGSPRPGGSFFSAVCGRRERAAPAAGEINAMKILIRKANKLTFLNGGIVLALVSWQIIGANGGGDSVGNMTHKLRIE